MTPTKAFLAKQAVGRSNRTHGEATERTPEYEAWKRMKERCSVGYWNAPNYAERGIRVCAEWLDSYQTFLGHVGRRPSVKHSLDRIDNDGDYTPSNVRWATRSEQNLNKRDNVWLVYQGERRTATDWANRLGICREKIYTRLRRGGRSVEEVLSKNKLEAK